MGVFTALAELFDKKKRDESKFLFTEYSNDDSMLFVHSISYAFWKKIPEISNSYLFSCLLIYWWTVQTISYSAYKVMLLLPVSTIRPHSGEQKCKQICFWYFFEKTIFFSVKTNIDNDIFYISRSENVNLYCFSRALDFFNKHFLVNCIHKNAFIPKG